MKTVWLLFCVTSLWLHSFAYAQHPETIAPKEHEKEVRAYQDHLNKEFKDPQQSPLSPKERKKFKGLPYFPIDYQYCVAATFVRDSMSKPFLMQTTTDRKPEYRKYGELHFTLNNQSLKLTVFQNLGLSQKAGYEDYLFVPFTDLTNGIESYGGGRYLDFRMAQLQGEKIRLDFNLAYNPYCAYGQNYSCPIPPAENRLPDSIPAGVKSHH
ncbi:MAG: DUF1684 domain-containing protein [Bacteroidota bacterium]